MDKYLSRRTLLASTIGLATLAVLDKPRDLPAKSDRLFVGYEKTQGVWHKWEINVTSAMYRVDGREWRPMQVDTVGKKKAYRING